MVWCFSYLAYVTLMGRHLCCWDAEWDMEGHKGAAVWGQTGACEGKRGTDGENAEETWSRLTSAIGRACTLCHIALPTSVQLPTSPRFLHAPMA